MHTELIVVLLLFVYCYCWQRSELFTVLVGLVLKWSMKFKETQMLVLHAGKNSCSVKHDFLLTSRPDCKLTKFFHA